MKKNLIIITVLLLTSSLSIFGQSISNLGFETEGKTIQIRYDLSGKTTDLYEVDVYISQDNGSWEGPLRFVSGDAGENVKAGKEKLIIWDVLKEKENLTGNLRFKIEVSNINSKPIIEWVSIPAGTFVMGSPKQEKSRKKDEVQHQVTLNSFKMSKYEITFAQYDSFCEATGRNKPDDASWGRGKRPVINVSWDDATAFAEWMGCRLPTEAEWEYACRAGTTTPFNTGSCLSTSQANYNGKFPYIGCIEGEARKKTLPVGEFSPNAWGLYDMHGNVWEWCNDLYGDYHVGNQTNPLGSLSGSRRVNRGGSWFNYAATYCRSADRYSNKPGSQYSNLGFRLVSTK